MVPALARTRGRADQVLYLGIGFRARKRRIDLHKNNLGHRQAEGPSDLAADQFGNQRPLTLTRAAKLKNIEPVIVPFDDCRQRATLFERRHIAPDANFSHNSSAPLIRTARAVVR